ncbi:putative cell wall protein [Vitis vinifera]|uniref:Cell wall protein n=1 Tax=Vitis vinifera TaxID=29760 RepID=F6HIG9_VITVI|nr:putative cell wall protein [Vitis vinifera]|eukprot:XP_010657269.1 PREDICTED: putative cell wall protein [Vitis vinifera]
MAHSLQASLIALLVIFNVLLGQAIAAREVPNDSKKVDKKQPEWFIEPDGSLLIPGLGRVMVPGYGSYTPYDGSIPSGSSGSDGSTGGTGSYIPGGDDTFVPNPGVEIPNPAGGGGVPTASRP